MSDGFVGDTSGLGDKLVDQIELSCIVHSLQSLTELLPEPIGPIILGGTKIKMCRTSWTTIHTQLGSMEVPVAT